MSPTDANSPNRRSSRRQGLRRSCELVMPDGTTRRGEIVETGLDGLSLLTARPITPGTRCRIGFELPLVGRPAQVQGSLKVIYSSFSGAAGFKIGAVYTELREGSADALREFTDSGA